MERKVVPRLKELTRSIGSALVFDQFITPPVAKINEAVSIRHMKIMRILIMLRMHEEIFCVDLPRRMRQFHAKVIVIP